MLLTLFGYTHRLNMEIKGGLSAAVLQVLDKDNYVVWSFQVKTYLMAHDLWDTVEATTKPPKQEDDEVVFKAWSEKNSTALHVLKVSCGQYALAMIMEINYAKIAWNTLAGLSFFLSLSFSQFDKCTYMVKQRLLLCAVVLQVLEKDNYVAWTVRVKTYLMDHDLWDVIEATTEPPSLEDDEAAFKAWSMKNSIALHVIQISCGPDTISKIIQISSAKIAWDTLAKMFLQVLKEDNYVAWTVQIKSYLMAHDLWEIIEATTEPPSLEDDEAAFKAWSMKNSTALHVIQISCRPDTISKIIQISSAKIVWDTLAKMFLQVLEEDNYADWSVQIKSYLMAHDFWEIIEATTEPPRQEDDEAAFKAWSKKNFMALRVIQVSCEIDIVFEIIQITSAKTAWDTLAEKYDVPTDADSGLPSLSLNCANAQNSRQVFL